MSNPRYKLLVLDYGGVYSHGYDKDTPFRLAKELFGSERPATDSNPELASLESDFSSGIVTTQHYIDELANVLKASKKPTPEILQKRMLEAAKDPSPAMVKLVAEVRSKGVSTVLLSDMCAFEIPIAEELNRLKGFDLVLLSAREGLNKRRKEFFELIFEKLPFQKSDAIFFDDSEYCIKSAQSVGIHSIHVIGTDMETPELLSDVIYNELFSKEQP